MSPTTPDQDQATSQADRIAIISIAALAIIGMIVLMLMHVATTDFTGFVVLLIVTVSGQLFTHSKVVKIDQQTNGNLTKRLDSQTDDIVNAVASLQEKPARKARSTPDSEHKSPMPVSAAVGADPAGE